VGAWSGSVWFGAVGGGAAVLYSVVVGAVRQFWVKTANYDRMIAIDTGIKVVPVTFAVSATTSDDGGGGSTVGSASLTISGPSGTIITPSNISLSASVSASGLNDSQAAYDSIAIKIVGPGPITIAGTVSGTAIADGFADGFAGLSANYPSISGFDGGRVGSGSLIGGVGSGVTLTLNVNLSVNTFIQGRSALLNGNYGFFRYVGGRDLGVRVFVDFTDTGPQVIEGSFSFPFDSAPFTTGKLLIFPGGGNYSMYEVINNQGANFKARYLSGTVEPSAFFSLAYLMSPFAAQIDYGLHTTDDAVIPYTAGNTLPVNLDDWRRAIVSLSPVDLSAELSCLTDSIYDPQSILSGGNLYTIDLSQIINGQTLQQRLQTSPATIAATLSTRTATSGASCTLGTAAESTVQVPSPGRGTVEGITYLP